MFTDLTLVWLSPNVYSVWAFYVHYSSLPVAHLQVLMGSNVIIEKADWSFRFGNLPTGTVFAQMSVLSSF